MCCAVVGVPVRGVSQLRVGGISKEVSGKRKKTKYQDDLKGDFQEIQFTDFLGKKQWGY